MAAPPWTPLVGINRDANLPNLAGSINNLAVDLAEAGRRSEGLTAAQEAVDLHRELVGINRDANLPNLAMSVNNLAIRLAEAGRRGQALALAREASVHYHDLARTNLDVFGPAAERTDAFVTALGENDSSVTTAAS